MGFLAGVVGALAFVVGVSWSAGSAGGAGEPTGDTVPIASEHGDAGAVEEAPPASTPSGAPSPTQAPAAAQPHEATPEEPEVEPVTTTTTEPPPDTTTTTVEPTTTTTEAEAASTRPGRGVPPWEGGTEPGGASGTGAVGAGR